MINRLNKKSIKNKKNKIPKIKNKYKNNKVKTIHTKKSGDFPQYSVGVKSLKKYLGSSLDNRITSYRPRLENFLRSPNLANKSCRRETLIGKKDGGERTAPASNDRCSNMYLNFLHLNDKVIGKGTSGEVRQIPCTCEPSGEISIKCYPNTKYAVKTTKWSSDNWVAAKNEVEILKKFSSDNNIMNIIDLVKKENEYIYLIMEYAGLTCKLDVYQYWSLDYAIDLMDQGEDILNVLKREHVVHADIKPANLCINKQKEKDILVLIDFGSAFKTDQSPDTCTHHTPSQQVSQIFRLTPTHASPCRTSVRNGDIEAYHLDEWSMAVTFFEFIFGSLPFLPTTEHPDYQVQIISLMNEIEERNVSVPESVKFRRRPLDSTKECKILLNFVDYFDNAGKESSLPSAPPSAQIGKLSFNNLWKTVKTSMNMSDAALSTSKDIECGISEDIKNRWKRAKIKILAVKQFQQLNKKKKYDLIYIGPKLKNS